MTDPTDLFTLCRRVEKLGGPEVPRHYESTNGETWPLKPGTYAAVLRDYAAGPVVEWLLRKHRVEIRVWFDDNKPECWFWKCTWYEAKDTEVRELEMVSNATDDTRDEAITAALSAALEIVGENTHD
jgi:hypothetical protein